MISHIIRRNVRSRSAVVAAFGTSTVEISGQSSFLVAWEGKLQISPKSKLSRAAKEKAKQPAHEGKIDVITPGKSPGSGHR